MSDDPTTGAWPALHYDDWRDTCQTLHLWTQIVGKLRLATTPWLNHSWHVPLYVSVRGLTTSPMPCRAGTCEVEFDFIDAVLRFAVSNGKRAELPLVPRTVAAFKVAVMRTLENLGVPIAISDLPCEIAGAIPFSEDGVHGAYDAQHARRFFRVLTSVAGVFGRFRTGFVGKSSPVHFFWGSFDLAVTRFSGRRAPLHPGQAPGLRAIVMQEAYSHEVSSAGFWPGGDGVDASFYAYAYPEPPGFKAARVAPAGARYDDKLGEYLLDYEEVRVAARPEAELLAFLQSTYEAAADAGNWDRASLECPIGDVGVCRMAG